MGRVGARGMGRVGARGMGRVGARDMGRGFRSIAACSAHQLMLQQISFVIQPFLLLPAHEAHAKEISGDWTKENCMHWSTLITACTGHHCMHCSSLHALVNPHHCMHWRYMGAHNSIECPLPTARYPRCHCSLPCPAFPLRTPHSPPNKTGCSLYLLEPLCQHRLQQQAHREISPRKIRLRICPNRSHTSNHTG